MPIIKIDGKDYDSDKMSAETKHQLNNLQVTDLEIKRLQAQLAIAQTARNTYARALSGSLAEQKDAVKLN